MPTMNHRRSAAIFAFGFIQLGVIAGRTVTLSDFDMPARWDWEQPAAFLRPRPVRVPG